jgi:hypothetical protein
MRIESAAAAQFVHGNLAGGGPGANRDALDGSVGVRLNLGEVSSTRIAIGGWL